MQQWEITLAVVLPICIIILLWLTIWLAYSMKSSKIVKQSIEKERRAAFDSGNNNMMI